MKGLYKRMKKYEKVYQDTKEKIKKIYINLLTFKKIML